VVRLFSTIQEDAVEVPQPSSQQLRRHWFNAAVPMVGFGMMDNFIMIQAGDFIDSTIGVRFGLATMTAAACGQICSDFSGVCFGGVIDAVAAKLGLPQSGLTSAQLKLRAVKNVGLFGGAIGVVVGCCIGMSCLFFMDLEKAERLKKQAELQTLFDTIMEHGHNIMDVDHCTLWLVENGTDASTGKQVSTRARAGAGMSEEALQSSYKLWDVDGKGINIQEVRQGLAKMGRTRSDSEVQALIASQTTKRPGVLDYDEFKALMTEIIMKEDVILPLRPNGLKGQVYSTKKLVNIDQVNKVGHTKSLRTNLDGYAGQRTHSILVSPIMDSDGEVIGMVEMVNKRSAEGTAIAFNETDEKMLGMLSCHAGIFIAATT